ncbi:hypothetical protein CGRA01v4_03570 [Colletotrichum graminicola]|nr:hypothetical protein CGRA01v4_03570 [Colletotrichum graminicola]
MSLRVQIERGIYSPARLQNPTYSQAISRKSSHTHFQTNTQYIYATSLFAARSSNVLPGHLRSFNPAYIFHVGTVVVMPANSAFADKYTRCRNSSLLSGSGLDSPCFPLMSRSHCSCSRVRHL